MVFEIPNTIQPQEHSRGGGTEDTLYITDSDGDLNVFNVEHDNDECWLNGNNGHPDNFWNGGNRWLFLRSKSVYFSPNLLLGEFCFVS